MDLTTKSNAELKTLHEWATSQYEGTRRKFEQAAHAREDAWMAVETIANELQRRIDADKQASVAAETAGRF